MTTAIEELKKIISKLRHPNEGCPWDISQTNHSLIPYVVEEAYEVVDAIKGGKDKDLIEELGDLLFQILIHSEIAKEQKRFTFEDVITHLKGKLIRRHPHVFNENGDNKISIEEVNLIWESIKRDEIAKKHANKQSKHPISDFLRHKIRSQHPLQGAVEISTRVAAEGFEWDTVSEIWDKVNEELIEFKKALTLEGKKSAENELGDVIFSLINIARWYNISLEEGLRKTNKRFIERFSYLERSTKGKVSKYDRSFQQQKWDEAKGLEKK